MLLLQTRHGDVAHLGVKVLDDAFMQVVRHRSRQLGALQLMRMAAASGWPIQMGRKACRRGS